MTVTTQQVRAVHEVTELVNAILYLCPEAVTAYEALGLEGRGQGYVAGRAAPLGPVPPEVVVATFYNFSPDIIRYAVPAAWSLASPAQLLSARAGAIEAVYERVGAPTEGLAELTDLALQAADGLVLAGRPLAAANAAVPLPGTPFADAWQALCVLREHRGDGHIAALVTHGVGPVEALALYSAWQSTVSRGFLARSRAWSEEAWAAADAALLERGWVDAEGRLTAAGVAVRDEIEAATDELAAAPYRRLGLDGTRRLFELARPLAVALNEGGGYKRPAPMPDVFPG